MTSCAVPASSEIVAVGFTISSVIVVLPALALVLVAHAAYIGVLAARAVGSDDVPHLPRTRVGDWYAGAIIITTCATCLVPQVLFVMTVWDVAATRAVTVLAGSLAAAVVVGRLIPPRYFTLRPCERDGQLYRRVGVRLFKAVVPDGDLIARYARSRYPDARGSILDCARLRALEARGRIAERAHLMSLVAAVPVATLAAALQHYGFAAVLLGANLLFHAYPVLLQRYTRARLTAILEARQARLAVTRRGAGAV